MILSVEYIHIYFFVLKLLKKQKVKKHQHCPALINKIHENQQKKATLEL